ncbi:MAG: hypothetical protein E7296_07780 [Lachnospiraceae bacterium]|jgi:hypothetical protein|nr:hypothetical protein [Lachnospiraceae bacterium]
MVTEDNFDYNRIEQIINAEDWGNAYIPMQNMWADTQFEILKEQIQEYEDSLDAEHEVGIMMTNFGQSVLMQVTNISYKDPVLIIFRGFVNGQESVLVQHINQLNFLLTRVSKEPNRPKRTIGFNTEI